MRLTAALALLLLLIFFFFHYAAAARTMPAAAVPPLLVHQENEVLKVVAANDGLVLENDGAAAGRNDELSSVAPEEVEEPACEEGNDVEDECMQRRLLRDAHLDYIYTQHKGKP